MSAEQNFNYRPIDNSSTTLNRYSEEAAHWVKAVEDHRVINERIPMGPIISVAVGLFFSLITSLFLIISSIVMFFISKRNKNVTTKVNGNVNRLPTNDELNEMFDEKTKTKVNIYE